MTPEIIKKARTNRELTQIEMANRIGVPASTYIAWESGKSNPNYENKMKIERFLDETDGN